MTARQTLATAKLGVDRAADLLLPPDRRGRNTLRSALHYAYLAHDMDPATMFEKLAKHAANEPERLVDLVVVLAGLVDVDKTPSQLLEWMCPVGQRPKPRYGTEKCGSIEGHMAHYELREDPCRPCQAAFERETRPIRHRSGPAKCGTSAGWQKHKRADEDPCEPCKLAMRAYWKNYYDSHFQPVGGTTTKIIGCPSRAGYERHVRRGEEPCAGCIAERRRYFRDRARGRYQKKGRPVQECPTRASKQRHRRNRQVCDVCWPPGKVDLPIWYPPAVLLEAGYRDGLLSPPAPQPAPSAPEPFFAEVELAVTNHGGATS